MAEDVNEDVGFGRAISEPMSSEHSYEVNFTGRITGALSNSAL